MDSSTIRLRIVPLPKICHFGLPTRLSDDCSGCRPHRGAGGEPADRVAWGESRASQPLMVQRNADDRAQVAGLAAFFRIAGNIHLAFRRAVAGEARFGVVFRHHDPVGWPPFGFGHRRIGIAARPVRGEQLCLDDRGLPAVRARLAVAHEFDRGGYLDLGLALGVASKRFADEPSEYRRDEPLEPDPFGVDGFLVGVNDLDDRLHYRPQQPAIARLRIDLGRIHPHFRFVELYGLVEDFLSGQPLVADIRIVDQVLIVRDDGAGVAQHFGEALRDGRIVAGGVRGGENSDRPAAKQQHRQQSSAHGPPARGGCILQGGPIRQGRPIPSNPCAPRALQRQSFDNTASLSPCRSPRKVADWRRRRRSHAQLAGDRVALPDARGTRRARQSSLERQDERHGRIHAAQGLGLEQAERRQVREHQPPDRGSDAREGTAGRQASAAALLAGHAERRQGHGHARRAAGAGPQGRGIRRLADPHRRGRPVRQRLCRDQPELEDPGAGRPQRPDADPGLRIRRDPDVPGREVRRVPADRAGRARRMPVVAVLADGQHALCRRRFRAFLRLCADQDRICDRPLHDGDEAPARRARPPLAEQRICRRQRLHDRRHGDLALVWRAGEVRPIRRGRVPRGARVQERAALGRHDLRTPGGEARAHGQPHCRGPVEPAARAPRRQRFRDQDAGQARRRTVGEIFFQNPSPSGDVATCRFSSSPTANRSAIRSAPRNGRRGSNSPPGIACSPITASTI